MLEIRCTKLNPAIWEKLRISLFRGLPEEHDYEKKFLLIFSVSYQTVLKIISSMSHDSRSYERVNTFTAKTKIAILHPGAKTFYESMNDLCLKFAVQSWISPFKKNWQYHFSRIIWGTRLRKKIFHLYSQFYIKWYLNHFLNCFLWVTGDSRCTERLNK